MIQKDDLEKDMVVIQMNLKQLEILYEDYLCGKIAKEPKDLRTQTEALIQKWRARTLTRTSSRFKFQSLTQRYNLFREKWERQLRSKEKEERGW